MMLLGPSACVRVSVVMSLLRPCVWRIVLSGGALLWRYTISRGAVQSYVGGQLGNVDIACLEVCVGHGASVCWEIREEGGQGENGEKKVGTCWACHEGSAPWASSAHAWIVLSHIPRSRSEMDPENHFDGCEI
jgi:hypothetical protein